MAKRALLLLLATAGVSMALPEAAFAARCVAGHSCFRWACDECVVVADGCAICWEEEENGFCGCRDGEPSDCPESCFTSGDCFMVRECMWVDGSGPCEWQRPPARIVRPRSALVKRILPRTKNVLRAGTA